MFHATLQVAWNFVQNFVNVEKKQCKILTLNPKTTKHITYKIHIYFKINETT
jgi:hypothetical protein